MLLTTQQSYELLEKHGIFAREICGKCGAVLGAVRFTRRDEAGVWCSRECRGDGERQKIRKDGRPRKYKDERTRKNAHAQQQRSFRLRSSVTKTYQQPIVSTGLTGAESPLSHYPLTRSDSARKTAPSEFGGLRLSLLAILYLLLSGPLFAQGSLANFMVFRYTPAGAFPASGATVTICTSSATGTPCSPTVSVYSDSALIHLVSNPLAICTVSPQIGCLDGLGNATFFATSGQYSYSVTGAGLNPYGPIALNLPCVVPLSCAATNAPNTWTQQQTFSAQIVSSVATGTAPFSIASTTVVPNLDAQFHNGLLAPASAIVGISDAQTLTNKTLTGASSGNSVSLLNAQANASAIVGTSSAVTIYTYTIPANTVGNLKGIRLTVTVNHSTGSASVAYALTLNGQSVWTNSNSLTGFGSGQFTILNTGATSGTFSRTAQLFGSGGDSWTDPIPSLSWSSNQALTLTFNVANTDQVTPIQWVVEVIQ